MAAEEAGGDLCPGEKAAGPAPPAGCCGRGRRAAWGSALQSRPLLFGIGGWVCSMSSDTARPWCSPGTSSLWGWGSSAHWDQQGPVRGSWLGTGTGHGSEKLGEAQPDTARMKCGLARGCRLWAIPTGSQCSQAPTDSAALSGC